MKEVLETIPVWDALKEDTECPICSLMKNTYELFKLQNVDKI